MTNKYIDAEKLKTEIRIIQQILEHRDVSSNQVKKIRTECMVEFCKCIFDVIDSLQQEQPAETDEVKWHNDEDYDETDKGRFVLGSVGIGYNGYYIPYSDLLKLPKEE